MKILEFLQDEVGRLSSMRLMSIVLVITGIVAIFLKYDTTQALGLISIGMAGKTLQNFTEGK